MSHVQVQNTKGLKKPMTADFKTNCDVGMNTSDIKKIKNSCKWNFKDEANNKQHFFPLFKWHSCKLAKLSACTAKCMTTIKKIYVLYFFLVTATKVTGNAVLRENYDQNMP